MAASLLAADAAPRPVRTCVTCHAAQAKPHIQTSMAHATETVAECAILRAHPVLTFKAGGFSYRIERKGDQSIYSVTGEAGTLSIPIKWALGLGEAGQTYVLEKDGTLYESLVSYYTALGGLDITMGDQSLHPTTLIEAAGRPMGTHEATTCLSCHTTNSLVSGKLNLESLAPGVQCERCHGDTANHLEGLKKGDAKLFAMKKLGALSAEDTSQFCGQCHRTWEQIAMNGPHGTLNVRFQPYRLANSKCFNVDDARIKCTTCHDPHKEIDRIASNYDARCQACHASAGGKPGAAICKVAQKDCSSCHMPKIELPGAHHRFTDHDIRVVKANGVYPD